MDLARLRWMARRSLELDARTLATTALPARMRLRLVAEKYSVLALGSGRGGGGRRMLPGGALTSEQVGTFQSVAADLFDLVVRPRVLAADDPVIVDVGANVGQFCWACRMFYPGARILSIEADPATFAALARNTEGLPGVERRNIGVAARDGVLPFTRSASPLESSFGGDVPDPTGSVDLPVASLDHVCENLGHIDLLKVDVEGFENEVIAGAPAVLARTDWLIIEIGLDNERGEGNIALLETIRAAVPGAKVVGTGRPLGRRGSLADCQDLLIKLGRN